MRNTAAALQKNPPAELALEPMEAERNDPSQAVDERFRINSASAWRGAAGAVDRPVRRILVPTDFSACSFRAVEHAVAMARQCDASLTLLHVIDITPAEASRHQGTADELMQQLRVRGTSELARLKSSLEQTQVRIQTGLIEG